MADVVDGSTFSEKTRKSGFFGKKPQKTPKNPVFGQKRQKQAKTRVFAKKRVFSRFSGFHGPPRLFGPTSESASIFPKFTDSSNT